MPFELRTRYTRKPKGWAPSSYAKAFSDAIFAKADLLRQFPELGRVVPEYGDPAIRELFYRHYRIFYLVAVDTVTITSVQSSRFPLQPLR